MICFFNKYKKSVQKHTDFFDNSLLSIVPDIPLVIRNKPHNNQLCTDLSRFISAYPVVSHFLRFAWQTTLAKHHLNEPDKLSGYMDNISNCGQKLLSLLNNVLDLARIENNKTVIENTINDIDDLFTSCITMFENSAEKKKLTISMRKNIK